MGSQDPADVIARALTPAKGLEPVEYQRMLAQRVMADLTEAGFVVIPDPDVDRWDTDAVRQLVEAATFDEDGRAHLDTTEAWNAMDWYCPSCREDVGWPKWANAYRDGDKVTVSIECGHCGYAPVYTPEGEQVD